MTWKERRTITILSSILLVLVIALLIVLGIRYRQSRETPVDSTEASGDALLTTADEYTSLSYYNGSATLSFSLDETGTWIWIDDPSFPLDDTTVTAILSELSSLKPQQTITDGATKAQELTDALFLQYPNVKCILTYGTDMAQGADEIALQKVDNKDQFAIFTVDTPEFIRGKIKESTDNTSMIRGTVMLGEGTPYTCYKLMDGSWMDRVVDGVYAERCIAITLDTMSQYFPE